LLQITLTILVIFRIYSKRYMSIIEIQIGVENFELKSNERTPLKIAPRSNAKKIVPFDPNAQNIPSNRQWPTGYMFNSVYLFNLKVW